MAVSEIKNECRRRMHESSKHMAILCLVSEIYLARELMNVKSARLRFICATVIWQLCIQLCNSVAQGMAVN